MKRFWILWNPASPKPPTYRFPTEEAAKDVAEKMATQFREEFFVCEAKSSSKISLPVVTTLLTKK